MPETTEPIPTEAQGSCKYEEPQTPLQGGRSRRRRALSPAPPQPPAQRQLVASGVQRAEKTTEQSASDIRVGTEASPLTLENAGHRAYWGEPFTLRLLLILKKKYFNSLHIVHIKSEQSNVHKIDVCVPSSMGRALEGRKLPFFWHTATSFTEVLDLDVTFASLI